MGSMNSVALGELWQVEDVAGTVTVRYCGLVSPVNAEEAAVLTGPGGYRLVDAEGHDLDAFEVVERREVMRRESARRETACCTG